MNTLWLYLADFHISKFSESEEIEGILHWTVSDAENELTPVSRCALHEIGDSLDEMFEERKFAAINLFVEDTLTLYVKEEVPGRSVSQIRRALPFAVEDYLSDDLDQVHIATGPISRFKPIECVAIQKEIVQTIIELLEETGIAPTFCSTVGLQVPLNEEEVQLHVLIGESLVWVRTADQIAAVEHDFAHEIIEPTLIGQEEPTKLLVHMLADSEMDIQRFASGDSEVINYDIGLLEWLVDNFEEGRSIDLLQGEFINQTVHSSLNIKELKVTGMFAAVLGGFYLVLMLVQGVWADIQTNRLENQMREIYVAIYDEQPHPTRNIATSMRNRMGVGSNVSQQFNYLLGQLASVVASPAHKVELNSLRFQSSLQSLSTEFEIPSLDDLDDFKAALENSYINVRINEAEHVESVKRTRANLTMSLVQ
ncbi:MAG: type II secretion system protein GspL [Gammaproteobacteria bacterium]|nr:type II secretion system protein GspL [Gammaproteobacteria bacterium]